MKNVINWTAGQVYVRSSIREQPKAVILLLEYFQI